MKSKIQIEPYQPFFLSGLLISILGLGIWVFFQLGWISSYPQEAHAVLMILGFLFAYITGFLMTAVPRMSQSFEARPFELSIGLVLLWAQVLLAFVGKAQWNYFLGVFQFLMLMAFIGIRISKRKANPPMGFVFLPFGFLAGAVGCFLLSLPLGILPGSVLYLAKNLLYQAFVLNLILGLGSRLIPVLSRAQGALDVRATNVEGPLHYLAIAGLLNSSFFLEAFVSIPLGQILKFFVITWMAVDKFKLLKPRQSPGYLGTGIRISIYCLGLGFLLAGLFPTYFIHFLHFSYIGGFALLTFLVSTRVVLAHGGYNLNIELQNKQIGWFVGLGLMIVVLRAVLGFEAQFRNEILLALFFLWMGLCVLWSRSFVSKLLKLPQHSDIPKKR